MKKRLIELDDELLAAARKELNTSGVSDTVRLAIQQAAALSARARQVEWLRGGGLLIDTNAAALAKHPRVADRIFTLIESGLAATTAQLDPEAPHSARLIRRITNYCGPTAAVRMSIPRLTTSTADRP